MTDDGLAVREMLDGLDFADLQGKVEARLQLANDWRPLTAPEV